MNSEIQFEGQSVRDEDFSGRRLSYLVAVGSRFERCTFEGTRIAHASLGAGTRASEYLGCNFDKSKMRLKTGGYARFVDCSFHDVDLREWFCFAVELVRCSFSGSIRKAVFNRTVPPAKREIAGRALNEIKGNEFTNCDLVDVGFRTGVDLTQQLLPTGFDYLYVDDVAAGLERLDRVIAEGSFLEPRSDLEALRRSLDTETKGGQKQLLLRRSNYSHLSPAAVNAVFELLDRV